MFHVKCANYIKKITFHLSNLFYNYKVSIQIEENLNSDLLHTNI